MSRHYFLSEVDSLAKIVSTVLLLCNTKKQVFECQKGLYSGKFYHLSEPESFSPEKWDFH